MDIEWLTFWNEAQKTARYYADKSREVGLDHNEVATYSSLCYLLERYYKINSKQLDKDITRWELENERDSDIDGSPNTS